MIDWNGLKVLKLKTQGRKLSLFLGWWDIFKPTIIMHVKSAVQIVGSLYFHKNSVLLDGSSYQNLQRLFHFSIMYKII